MSLVGKNRKVFSYNNSDVRDKLFQNKDFNKAQPYHSNFSQSRFENSSFSATKFKFCAMYESTFDDCDFTGTLFRKCNLQKARFNRCLIRASQFEGCKMKGAIFSECIIVGSNVPVGYDLGLNNISLTSNPSVNDFDPLLIGLIEDLRSNKFIRKSAIFHLKRQRINTVTLKYLMMRFDIDFLLEYIPRLKSEIKRDFYTVSYIVKALTRLAESTKI
ncbi:pentapeptide repeat-containing protein [Pseudomonas aeruginosa]|uniref:pentapeptide repeat-containing protein n=1 Tax=Pseudomonas aeruginosa TaxID=287 RepID=UPI000F7D859D|nr:pentapeptide repeat-containing protein [Pseudomonas aeruginosa]RTB44079.1 hypothetical protein EJ655_08030 [Pseudomonas aeruginosa]